MALDKDFFDSIHIDVVKKKYYNAGKVESVFSQIREQAEALTEENKLMKLRLSELENKRYDIGEAIISAQSIYNDIISKANAKAATIIADAKAKREELLGGSLQQQEQAVQRVESFYTRLRDSHLASIEALNNEWQSFLCSLVTEDDDLGDHDFSDDSVECSANDSPFALTESVDDSVLFGDSDVDLPSEIKAQMDAIAQQIFSLEDDF